MRQTHKQGKENMGLSHHWQWRIARRIGSIISYHQRQLYSVPFLLRSVPFLRNCCMLLALPISPQKMDGFWCSRCLNDRVEVPDMMRLFAGGATTPLVVKIWTKQPWVKIENLLFALPISPEIMDRFWCSRCLNDRVEVPDMMRLFAGGATTPLVVKIWTKQP